MCRKLHTRVSQLHVEYIIVGFVISGFTERPTVQFNHIGLLLVKNKSYKLHYEADVVRFSYKFGSKVYAGIQVCRPKRFVSCVSRRIKVSECVVFETRAARKIA